MKIAVPMIAVAAALMAPLAASAASVAVTGPLAASAASVAPPASAARVEIVATLATEPAALEALVENPDGSFWMTSNFDRALWRISPAGAVLQRIVLNFYPQVVVRRPRGGLVVTGHRRLPAGIAAMLTPPPTAAMPAPPPIAETAPPSSSPSPMRMVGLGTLVALVDEHGAVGRVFAGPADSFFNGIDRVEGDHYIVADSIGGSLWLFDARAGSLARWLTDVSIEGPGGKPGFGGSNGLKVHRGAVYYTSRGGLWRVAIGADGKPNGVPAMFAPVGNDDFDFGPNDILYLPTGKTLSTVSPSGKVEPLVETGVNAPTARVTHDGKSVFLLTRGIVPPGGGAPESKLMMVHL